ncbi:hypothetical protein HP499_14480 [Paenarthrobacter sp. CM16]|uniref:hypothetical protein n=1 Tax=Paenarthrobacter sp. CM16 TaxID=2738447 RepID=UPI0015560328|nr:hypothetical protein [Paenarthrobacter sp. CM16]NQD89000.1 hypothetical protein [Paenarthrobacter sp. CM16]
MMFSQDKKFRKPGGTHHDPISFNVRQYEEQYVPGAAPQGYSMGAITPVQSPGLITAPAVLVTIMSFGVIFLGFLAIAAGGELL